MTDAMLEARLFPDAGTKQGHRRQVEPDWAGTMTGMFRVRGSFLRLRTGSQRSMTGISRSIKITSGCSVIRISKLQIGCLAMGFSNLIRLGVICPLIEVKRPLPKRIFRLGYAAEASTPVRRILSRMLFTSCRDRCGSGGGVCATAKEKRLQRRHDN